VTKVARLIVEYLKQGKVTKLSIVVNKPIDFKELGFEISLEEKELKLIKIAMDFKFMVKN
jgi:hypothetical protein